MESILHKHQIRALESIAKSTNGMLIYHSMGLGKSFIIAQCTFDEIRAGRKPIILHNKAIKENIIQNMIKYIRLAGTANEHDDANLRLFLQANVAFVSMNANNMWKKMQMELPLYGRLILVDDAHNLFRAIINRSNNAWQFYQEIMMRGRMLTKIVFFTGTPFANSVNEIIPCINMMHGRRVIPDDDEEKQMKKYIFYEEEELRINRSCELFDLLRDRVFFSTYQDMSGGVDFPEVLKFKTIYVDMNNHEQMDYEAVYALEKTNIFFSRNTQKVGKLLTKSRQACNVSQKQLEATVSSKFTVILGEIEKHNSPGLLYSQFIDNGIMAFGKYLLTSGWQEYGQPACQGKTFAIITGKTPSKIAQSIIEAFNQPSNTNGSIIRLVMVTAVGTEGISLMRVRHVHIMEPYWNMGRIEQIVHRACRLGSHSDLPPRDRNVQPYIYISKTWDKRILTADEQLWNITLGKHRLEVMFENLLKEVSI